MTLDLSGLERAAARAGLPGLRARLVASDPRRDAWFTWRDGELLVAEKVVERCRPADGEALLVDAILEDRGRRRWRRGVLLAIPGLALLVGGALTWWPAPWSWVGAGILVALAVAAVLVARAGVTLRADDAAVALLGEAESLVRAFNAVRHDEIHIGSLAMPARPDLHRRAERLAQRHRLCAGAAGGPAPAGRSAAGARGD